MKSLSNRNLVMMFMASLIFMGMAGLPIAILADDNKPSVFVITALRLFFVGLFAIACSAVTGHHKVLIGDVKPDDIVQLGKFFLMAVIGVNGSLTIALYFLDDHRMAMAIMLAFVGFVFLFNHFRVIEAWGAVAFAISGAALLAIEDADINLTNPGYYFAAICGTVQGVMFLKGRLLPQSINPGVALGGMFLLGGLVAMGGTALFAPSELRRMVDLDIVTNMFFSAALTLPAWLILGYCAQKLSDTDKSRATAMEPVGAAITDFIVEEKVAATGIIGVLLLMISAYMGKFIPKK